MYLVGRVSSSVEVVLVDDGVQEKSELLEGFVLQIADFPIIHMVEVRVPLKSTITVMDKILYDVLLFLAQGIEGFFDLIGIMKLEKNVFRIFFCNQFFYKFYAILVFGFNTGIVWF